VDAAARAAREAENYETQKEYSEAIKWHGKAEQFYKQAALNLKSKQEEVGALSTCDKELIISFD